MWFRRLLAAMFMSVLLAPALADEQSDALRFLTEQLGLPANWKPEAGSAPPRWAVNKNLFGLSGVTLDSITADAAASDGKPTGALTANLSIGGEKFSGTLGSKAGTGGPEEVWILLAGGGLVNVSKVAAGVASRYPGVPKLDNLQLRSARVGFRPGSKLGYLSGALVAADSDPWKGSAAVMAGDARVSLFVQAGEVDLQALLKPAAPIQLPKLPQSVLMFNSATGQAPSLESLPLPVQAMFSAVTQGLPLPDAFPVGEGFGVWSRVTPQQLRIPEATPLKLPAMLVGGEVNPGQSVSLAAALNASALRLADWRFSKPSFYFSHKQMGGPKFGVNANVEMRLAGDPVSLNGDFAIEAQTGALAFTGRLDRRWSSPFALQGVSINNNTGITLSLDAALKLGLGVQGGLSINGVTNIKDTLVCANATLSTGVPVVTGVGLRFAADSLDPAVALRLIDSLVQFAAKSPAGSALADLKVPGGGSLGTAKPANLSAQLAGTPMPSIDAANFYLVTPGLTCNLPANTGMGAELKGTMSFMGQPLAKTDSGFNLDKGFWLGGELASFNVAKLFSLGNAKVDIGVPMPTSAQIANTRFKVSGRTTLAIAEGNLVVNFSKDRVQFDAEAALADFFKAKLDAYSVDASGRPTANLSGATDFKLALAATADTEGLKKEVLKGLAAALRPKATAKKNDIKRPDASTLAAAKRSAERLDREVGDVYRRLVQLVSTANACLQGDTGACGRLGSRALKAAEELADATRQLADLADKVEEWGRVEGAYQALKAADEIGLVSEQLWTGFISQLDGFLTNVANTASVVSITRMAFDGSLRQSKGTLAIDLKLDPTFINPAFAPAELKKTFEVDLGKTLAGPRGGSSFDSFSDDVVAGYAGLKRTEQLAPLKLPTTTHLRWATNNGQFTLTAKVASDVLAQQSGGAVRPTGALTLYRVGSDNKPAAVASSTELNQKDGCNNPADSVLFPAPAGSGCTTRGTTAARAFTLELQPGANVFHVEYAGDSSYAPSVSKVIVINVDAACGRLAKLAGAKVRFARPKSSTPPALDYFSVSSVVNSELGVSVSSPKPLYLFDKARHPKYWDLQFQLTAVPGRADEFIVETARECGSVTCPRLVLSSGGLVELQPVLRTESTRTWKITPVAGGERQFQISTTRSCPSSAAVCYLGLNPNSKPTFGDPGSPATLGQLMAQPTAPSPNLALEEVCSGN